MNEWVVKSDVSKKEKIGMTIDIQIINTITSTQFLFPKCKVHEALMNVHH